MLIRLQTPLSYVFFFNDTATTEIYTLSLHDALPISVKALNLATTALASEAGNVPFAALECAAITVSRFVVRPSRRKKSRWPRDRKSTRLNSSHSQISYAVFCLQKNMMRSRFQLSVLS